MYRRPTDDRRPTTRPTAVSSIPWQGALKDFEAKKSSEISRVCHRHYSEFIDSVEDLMKMKVDMVSLRDQASSNAVNCFGKRGRRGGGGQEKGDTDGLREEKGRGGRGGAGREGGKSVCAG